MTLFQDKVYNVVRKIPMGKVLRGRTLITCAFSSNLHVICVPKNSMRSFTTPPIFLNTSGTHLGEKVSSY